jgi:hypothetical protein
MVAVIKTGSSLRRIVNYNEQKVKAGVAQCILAANYPKDLELLTLPNKLNRLLHQAALNENVTRNSVHISLNFDPAENLNHDQLRAIAGDYMQKIGFDQQPFLVYQHHDAAHPHIHLVTVKVRADGSRIDMQNIGRNQSEKARRELEETYGLVKAEDAKKGQVYALKPVSVQKVQYGRSETKRAITNVLDAVLNTYKYASLPELNAVLGQYNVTADPGTETSRVHQHQGLLYRIVDEGGNRVGVPIKASDFHHQPTLKYLEERFRQNEIARQSQKARVKSAVDLTLLKQPNLTLTNLIKTLAKEGIAVVSRKNADGRVYGLTYVDHRTKCVFNGSVLGKPYSALGIQQRCAPEASLTPQLVNQHPGETKPWQTDNIPKESAANQKQKAYSNGQFTPAESSHPAEAGNLLNILLKPKTEADYVPQALKKNSRKKKKKSFNSNE